MMMLTNRRRWLLLGSLAVLPGLGHAQKPPARNLLVELRWTESSISGAKLDGARRGAVVVGTAGSVSPRPSTTLSTRRREDEDEGQMHRLVVLNGHEASVLLSSVELLQWVDAGMDDEQSSSESTNTNFDASGAASGGSKSSASGTSHRNQARQRSMPVERRRGFALTPYWPGGRQPVRVEVRAMADGGKLTPQQRQTPSAGQNPTLSAQAEILSTVQTSLGEWTTVARSGAATRQPEPGVLSSSDAENQTSRELQIRVSLAP